jgi:pyrroline-5-carboxylate reductase
MNESLSRSTISFVGAGAMAEALIRGIVEQKKVAPDRVIVMNRSNRERLVELNRKYGVRTAADPASKAEALRQSDIIVLAFKPKDAGTGLREIAPHLTGRQLIASVIAGLSIASIQGILGQVPVVRAMPNTSSTIGLGATGMSFSKELQEDAQARNMAEELFAASGIVSLVEESMHDIVTGLSGSGPAYVYYFIEAMIQAGVEGGLAADEARKFAVQTVLGAARMVELTGEEPSALRKKVTSPNGTTQAALEVLDRRGFGEAVRQAVHRAADRSREMGAEVNAALKNE